MIGESRVSSLAASEYEDTIYPDGFRYLDEMRLDPFPVFTYMAGGVRLTQVRLHGLRPRTPPCVTYRHRAAARGRRVDRGAARGPAPSCLPESPRPHEGEPRLRSRRST